MQLEQCISLVIVTVLGCTSSVASAQQAGDSVETDEAGEAGGGGNQGEEQEEEEEEDSTFSSLSDALESAREGRCATAICWGESFEFAFEPLAELPLGKTFAIGAPGMMDYINNSSFAVSLVAGLRFWFLHDWMSVSIYLSNPLITGGDSFGVPGSTFDYRPSQIHRPYPGIGIGLFGDMIWIGLDLEELRNGTGDAADPLFSPNTVVARTFTITIAIATVASIRNGLGIAMNDSEGDEEESPRGGQPATPQDPPPSGTETGADPSADPADETPSEGSADPGEGSTVDEINPAPVSMATPEP